MMQLELDYKAYQRNSDTSKSAWENKKNKVTLKEQVYDLLLNNPLANHQIADTMEIPLSSVCARIRELQLEDKIEDSGKRALSQYKRECVIWQRKK
jgi:predicted Rossmann fold nucleotide-binding protein DprA/Smf involved in DNA uptake|tara:strand:+ start:225 stop:512 length:288 start_codon:yes stop_codon:yes gene_type:complete